MFDLKKAIASAVFSAGLLLPSVSSALTLQFYDSACNTYTTINDGDLGDASGATGTVSADLTAACEGGASVWISAAIAVDEVGNSILELAALYANTAEGYLTIDAWHSDFGGAAADPLYSNVYFEADPTHLNIGSEEGSFYASGFADLQLVADGDMYTSDDEVVGSLAKVLSDPFGLWISTSLSAMSTVTFDATLIASIPLPAGGLLLLTALGGLGIARRRRSAEPALA